MKRFHHERRLQVYMYDFMYVYPEKIPVEYHFPATKTSADNYKNNSTTGTVPKHWLVFSCIHSEEYELYVNFDETELEKQLYYIS